MRRTFGAFVGIVLMFVVMMASVGVTYVRCAHTGRVSLAISGSMSGMNDSHDDSDGCGAAVKSSHCMQVSVLKMLTQFQQPQPTPHFDCPSMAVAPFIVSLLPKPLETLARPLSPQTASGYYGPPRSYLQRLSILII